MSANAAVPPFVMDETADRGAIDANRARPLLRSLLLPCYPVHSQPVTRPQQFALFRVFSGFGWEPCLRESYKQRWIARLQQGLGRHGVTACRWTDPPILQMTGVSSLMANTIAKRKIPNRLGVINNFCLVRAFKKVQPRARQGRLSFLRFGVLMNSAKSFEKLVRIPRDY